MRTANLRLPIQGPIVRVGHTRMKAIEYYVIHNVLSRVLAIILTYELSCVWRVEIHHVASPVLSDL